ncbi:enoyl-CoA hydratase/isomerase family protein [Pseudonocardia broussonetiae]|uniref:Enoyl-CoA hydratase/isomerase family protein n=1 Tax=Pseudonocardia broussonetiae TaxID=2736640 RepID=A0A6M6JRI5_9PSEU|nr:enoyl-CoA hydratase/isomerase family protein [Pseudonocardia broussonetiae]QJY49920.1 enoyl-CoA hydratase/isomerase family protein [Pseudonocardia broussonetiae]
MSAAATVRVEHDGAVARIVLDRPDRHNAQTPGMWRELREATDALVADPAVRVAVLTGDGPSFSSGLDLDERRPGGLLHRIATTDPGEGLAVTEQAQADFRWLSRAPFPVVAAVHGAALGAGLQLALSCDVRIVAEDAVLAVAELGLGAVPDLGATTDLPRLVGLERALDLILTARRFSGTEAVELGLALRAVPAADLEAEALAYAERLAAAPRLALARAKEATREPDPARSLRLAATAQVECVRAMLSSPTTRP